MTIIAMLFGMLLPSLKRSVSLANSTVCQFNLREIGQMLRVYRAEYDGWLPVSNPIQTSVVAQAPSEPDVWFMRLYPDYLGDLSFLSCPEDPFRFRMEEIAHSSDHTEIADYASYGINGFMMTGGKGMLAHVERFEPSKPGDTILLSDLGPDTIHGSARGGGGGITDGGHVRNQSLLAWGDGFDIFEGMSNPWLTTRHNRGYGINMLTLGGGLRRVRTVDQLSRPILDHYDDCDDGGCTLCRELRLYHYSFASDRLFWYTGPLPRMARTSLGS
ncbi:MAG: hypothetical protein ACE5E5_10260 [Phycisphaerae bacterium]